jgi:hypothetical protein
LAASFINVPPRLDHSIMMLKNKKINIRRTGLTNKEQPFRIYIFCFRDWLDPVEVILMRTGRQTEADNIGLLPKHTGLASHA